MCFGAQIPKTGDSAPDPRNFVKKEEEEEKKIKSLTLNIICALFTEFLFIGWTYVIVGHFKSDGLN